MGTSANPMAGQYFNDPHFAAAVSNLAGAFAPPSADEYLTAEQVKGLRTSNSALADLYAQAGGDFDKLGVVADLYDPSNSYYSVDTDAATARRGQDVTAETSRYNTVADAATARRGQDVTAETSRYNTVAGGLIDRASTPLAYGQGLPAVDDALAEFIGGPALPGQTGAALGVPEPLPSEDEVKAMILQGLTPEEQRATVNIDLANVVGGDGQSVYSTELDAVGRDAFVNPGGQAAATAITFDRGGVRMGGFITPDGKYTDSNGGPLTPEEAGTAAEVGKPVGTNSELGITNSNVTLSGRIDATLAESDMLIDSLAAEIEGQAGAAGLAGTIQSVGQNVLQVGRELGTAFGGDPNALVTPEMLESIGQADGPYDPTFARIRSGMLQLAYLNAQRDNPSGEVSRFALERQIEALGQGALANDQSILAALGMNKEANARKRAASKALLGQAVTPPGAPPATGGAVTITSDADYDALPSGTEFTAPDGTTRRKP